MVFVTYEGEVCIHAVELFYLIDIIELLMRERKRAHANRLAFKTRFAYVNQSGGRALWMYKFSHACTDKSPLYISIRVAYLIN